VTYPLQNALFAWEEGARRVREAAEASAALERAAEAVVEQLRRRLGSSFRVAELADLYAQGHSWSEEAALAAGAGTRAGWVVDAAFARYAREAQDFGGGRPHERPARD
jgi:hypothetical protein